MKAKKRRTYGTGSFHRDARGNWVGQLRYKDQSGVSRRKTVRDRDRYKCIQKMDAFRIDLGQGISQSGKVSVGEVARRFVSAHEMRVRPQSLERIASVIRNDIPAEIGRKPISSVTAAELEALFGTLAQRSPSASRKAFAVLHQIWSRALRDRVISTNIFDSLAAPRYKPKPVRPLSTEEELALLSASTDTPYSALIMLALDSGARQGELFALRWSDVDFEESLVQIYRSVIQVGSNVLIGDVKTRASRRNVQISRATLSALRAHRDLRPSDRGGSDLVFGDRLGGPLRRQNFNRRAWHQLCEAAGLVDSEGRPGFTFHDLRHTCATRLLIHGIHPKVVQERLGHAGISMTLDTYSHLIKPMQHTAADAFDNHLMGRRLSDSPPQYYGARLRSGEP